MPMKANARFSIVLGITLFSVVFKWFTLHFVATVPVRKWCLKIFNRFPRLPNFGRLFRSLGFDWANAALGLWVLACVLENSNLRKWCSWTGNYALIFAILSFIVVLVMYGFAVKGQHVFVEEAERECAKRWSCASVVWVIGLLMLV